MTLTARILVWMAVAVFTVPIVVLALDTATPMVFIMADVVPDSGTPGAKVVMSYRVEQRRDDGECMITADRQWVDSRGIVWDLADMKLHYERGFQDVVLTSNIPMDASPGLLRMEGSLRWSCNRFQKLFQRAEPFPTLTVNVIR